MKKLAIFAAVFALFLTVSPVQAKNQQRQCTKIQEGTLLNSEGEVITTGYNLWGYNYQAHIFNGKYCDAYYGADWCQPYKDDNLEMKWNDAWLSNKDCDGDGLLDRHYGFYSYIDSGAWLTNHQSGTYVDDNGVTQKWNYFVKIIAVSSDDKLVDGVWYNADEVEIGPAIWGEFAIIQQISNDKGLDEHGVLYHSPLHVGLGNW